MLDSWEHMGMEHAQCLSGCTCEEAVFDSSFPAVYAQPTWLPAAMTCGAGTELCACRHVSLVYWKPLPVQVQENSSTCLIRVTNYNRTTSGEHKVKVRSGLWLQP